MAGNITGVLNRIQTQQGRPKMAEVVLTCTADAGDGSYPETVVNTLAGLAGFDIRGLKLYSVKTIPGTPGPTDNSDVAITDKYGIDLLGGKGTDIIDNTAKNWVVFGYSTYTIEPLITGNISIVITGNIVNSAITTVVIELVGA